MAAVQKCTAKIFRGTAVVNIHQPGLPDDAKYCQKSLFSKKFTNSFWQTCLCQKLPFF